MSEIESSEDEAKPGTQEFRDEGKRSDLLPNKSGAAYEMSYDRFIKWQRQQHTTSLSQRVFIAYFSCLSKKFKSSTLWSEYSKVAKMIRIKNNVDLGQYRELKALLKKASLGYRPKKSKSLTLENVEKFLNEAPDYTFLATKVAMIFGVFGACRKGTLIKIETTHLRTHFEPNDPAKKRPILTVSVPATETQKEREFTIRGRYYSYYQRYIDMRLENMPHNRFFMNYHNGKCTGRPIGEKKFAAMPKDVAQFLKLANPESYTGHAFRRNSAPPPVEGRADGEGLRRGNEWESTSAAQGCFEKLLLVKEEPGDETTGQNRLNLQSSNDETTSAEDPLKSDDAEPPSTSKSSTTIENTDLTIDLTALNKNITLNISHCTITFNVLDKK